MLCPTFVMMISSSKQQLLRPATSMLCSEIIRTKGGPLSFPLKTFAPVWQKSFHTPTQTSYIIGQILRDVPSTQTWLKTVPLLLSEAHLRHWKSMKNLQYLFSLHPKEKVLNLVNRIQFQIPPFHPFLSRQSTSQFRKTHLHASEPLLCSALCKTVPPFHPVWDKFFILLHISIKKLTMRLYLLFNHSIITIKEFKLMIQVSLHPLFSTTSTKKIFNLVTVRKNLNTSILINTLDPHIKTYPLVRILASHLQVPTQNGLSRVSPMRMITKSINRPHPLYALLMVLNLTNINVLKRFNPSFSVVLNLLNFLLPSSPTFSKGNLSNLRKSKESSWQLEEVTVRQCRLAPIRKVWRLLLKLHQPSSTIKASGYIISTFFVKPSEMHFPQVLLTLTPIQNSLLVRVFPTEREPIGSALPITMTLSDVLLQIKPFWAFAIGITQKLAFSKLNIWVQLLITKILCLILLSIPILRNFSILNLETVQLFLHRLLFH